MTDNSSISQADHPASSYQDKLSHAGDAMRKGLASTRDSLHNARVRATDGVDHNPFTALIGGAAIGALLAVVLPATRREKEQLGPVGRKINTRAREVAHVAADAGKAKLDELGINRENAKAQMQKLVDSAKDVAETARAAATRNPSGPAS